jgi:hypothetical protein
MCVSPPGSLSLTGPPAHPHVCQVLEETGVKAKFASIVTMRHNTRYIFGKSDLYIVCRLVAEDPTLAPDFTEVSCTRYPRVCPIFSHTDTHALHLSFERRKAIATTFSGST